MSRRIVFVALLLAAAPVAAQDRETVVDELKLQSAGLAADGPALLEFFRLRTRESVPAETLAGLVKQLADKDAEARQKAVRQLIGLGPLAVPALRAAAGDADHPEAAALARRALQQVQGEEAAGLPVAAARVLADRRPAGLAEVLLAYLPYADTDDVLEEVKNALVGGAQAEGKVDPLLLKALEDPLPLRRAVAIDVICSRGQAEPRATLRKLLVDPKPSVRLRAALALAQVKDPKAVSTLIVLLGELPYQSAREAEEYLATLAAEQAPKTALGPDEASRQKAKTLWGEWWLQSEKPELLDEFKKRTMTEEARDQAAGLIRDLGSEEFKTRERAEIKLREMGVLVLPLLRKAAESDTDQEVRTRAKLCIREIEKAQTGPLSPVFPRLVGYRRPEGGTEVLLRYLPFAEDPSVISEVQTALAAMAYKDGAPDKALVDALADKVPVRRVAAAVALARPGAEKELALVRKLLKDAEPSVRAQSALALAGAGDREAVGVMIELIAELPAAQTAALEEYLGRLAGDDMPAVEGADDEAGRKKRSETWAGWWKASGAKVRMLALNESGRRERQLGFTLVVSPNWSKVFEVGADGKTRWEIQGLSNPWDAEVLPNGRVLVLESGLRRLSERSQRGEILWQLQLQNVYPTAAQRLPNGNVFVTSSNRLLEVTRQGKEVFSFHRPNGDIMYARKMKDGQVIYVTSSSTAHKVDASGRETKNWRITHPSHNGIDILPNGNVLIPQQYNNRVYEYDQNGQQVWSATATQPMAVRRLANGNTLVASYQPYQLAEIDKNGRELWKTTMTVQGMRLSRR